jgi:hypothetical protein
MLILVVSDTSDRTRLGQKPSLARGFVGVSNSTITSFSWLLIEIDTPVPNELGASATTAQGRSRAASPQHQFGKGEIGFLPNKAKKWFVFNDSDTERFCRRNCVLTSTLPRGISRRLSEGNLLLI